MSNAVVIDFEDDWEDIERQTMDDQPKLRTHVSNASLTHLFGCLAPVFFCFRVLKQSVMTKRPKYE